MDQIDLSELRRRIDALDDQLLGLIGDRSRIVEDVIRAKAGTPGGAMRPAREAQILRRLAEQHTGPLPFATIARIWRELISALTVMQQPDFSVALTDEAALPAARNHFGGGVPMSALQSAQAVIRAVSMGEVTLGLLPVPDGEGTAPWWPYLMGNGLGDNPPRVVLRLPFVETVSTKDGGDWLAISCIPQDPSDSDSTLLALTLPHSTSRSAVLDRLQVAGFEGVQLLDMSVDASLALLVVNGFVATEDTRLSALAGADTSWLDQIQVIGSYANPIRA